MVNLCICSLQVHQPRVILCGPHSHPQWLLPNALAGLCASVLPGGWQTALPSLDPVLGLVVVHRLLSLGQEGVHALVCAQEPVHAHDGLKGQNAVREGGDRRLRIS